MKNIGIITHNFPLSLNDRQNAGIFVNDIVQELSREDKIAVYCPQETVRRGKMGKVKVESFSWMGGKKLGDLNFLNPIDVIRFFSFLIGGLSNLSKFILGNKIDINIVMWAFPSGVFAYIANKIYKVPYVVWCLGSDIYVYANKPILKTVIRFILRDAVFVFADGIDLADKTKKISGRECIFIPSASKADFRQSKRKLDPKFITLTFVGRLEKVKGFDLLIESLISIKKGLSNFKVNIIGSGSLLEKLKQKTVSENIDRYINFYGNINSFQKISEMVGNSDWLVIPSRSDSIPLVFSEAMKCGTPIIASSLSDLSYLVKTYKVGYLFSPGNFRQLADIIVKLPKLEKQRRKFAVNTKKAAEDFSVERSSQKIISYLEKI